MERLQFAALAEADGGGRLRHVGVAERGVGFAEGTGVGFAVGTGVGFAIGAGVGFAVGAGVGFAVGVGVGFAVGAAVGFAVGAAVGFAVGAADAASRSKRIRIVAPCARVAFPAGSSVVLLMP